MDDDNDEGEDEADDDDDDDNDVDVDVGVNVNMFFRSEPFWVGIFPGFVSATSPLRQDDIMDDDIVDAGEEDEELV